MRSEDQHSGQSAEAGVYRMTTHWPSTHQLIPRGVLSYVMGVRGPLSSLHLLSLLPLRCWVCAKAARRWSRLLPLVTLASLCPPLSLKGWMVSWVGMLGQGGASPTFSLVDIWYPRGFSVSPPGQMIFLSLGMTWGWEYEMEGGHAGVLAPGP